MSLSSGISDHERCRSQAVKQDKINETMMATIAQAGKP
ncbi:uncharacterized protein METZ01_LOCUS199394, partial [marine metagenome]